LYGKVTSTKSRFAGDGDLGRVVMVALVHVLVVVLL